MTDDRPRDDDEVWMLSDAEFFSMLFPEWPDPPATDEEAREDEDEESPSEYRVDGVLR